MILYHGSNVDIESIDLGRSSVGKDFGCGFYLTASREQAERMGRRRARLYGGEMVVSTFEFDENAAREAGLNIKDFGTYSKEWADFVLANRKNDTRTQIHDFDIVHGPIANDDVGFQIRRLLAGMITIETFLEELKYKEGITYQYFFATERSVQFLKKL
ncbi:MAG: DUF3990 domain-containing protein [Bacteroidales bacterium]|jgi:hypothetical protein|nr:DUF3990 domain-containing protein [Bacteroidales bacterium]